MWRLDLSQIKQIQLREFLVRFLLGGAVSVLAALIAQWTTIRIGGIFTTFPAILLASLTIIGEHEEKQAAEADAQGAIIGAVALVVASIVLSITLKFLVGAGAIFITLAIWLALSIGLYFLSIKLGWLHVEGKGDDLA